MISIMVQLFIEATLYRSIDSVRESETQDYPYVLKHHVAVLE